MGTTTASAAKAKTTRPRKPVQKIDTISIPRVTITMLRTGLDSLINGDNKNTVVLAARLLGTLDAVLQQAGEPSTTTPTTTPTTAAPTGFGLD